MNNRDNARIGTTIADDADLSLTTLHALGQRSCDELSECSIIISIVAVVALTNFQPIGQILEVVVLFTLEAFPIGEARHSALILNEAIGLFFHLASLFILFLNNGIAITTLNRSSHILETVVESHYVVHAVEEHNTIVLTSILRRWGKALAVPETIDWGTIRFLHILCTCRNDTIIIIIVLLGFHHVAHVETEVHIGTREVANDYSKGIVDDDGHVELSAKVVDFLLAHLEGCKECVR